MFTLLLVALALAAPPDRPPPPPPPLEEVLEAVGLSDGQRVAVETLIREARPELEALRATLHDRERALIDDIEALLSPQQQEDLRAALPPPPREGGRR